MNKVLIVDDELNMRLVLGAMLKKEGYDVASAADGREALDILKAGRIAAVVTDLKMPHIDGMELLRRMSELYPEVPVVMITAHGTVATAVEALKKGALDYITKPFEIEELKNVIAKAVKTRNLKDNELYLPPDDIEKAGMVGAGRASGELFEAIHRVAPTTTTVLITGETGTGKELVAEAIHANSPRRTNPLIKINCAAIAETLMESELFGYEKGAFTGAAITKPGKFELANKGTLFLDEIGEVPRDMQVKLLRVLQEQEFERVGGLKTIKVDVRIIVRRTRICSKMSRREPSAKICSTASMCSRFACRPCGKGSTTWICWWRISSKSSTENWGFPFPERTTTSVKASVCMPGRATSANWKTSLKE